MRLVAGFLLVGVAFEGGATNHILRQEEMLAGMNGDGRIQYIQITVGGGDQKAWGPPGTGAPSRAMLVFFDGAGNETGRFFFPNNAPPGQNTVLIATTNFAQLPGAPIPDFIMPPLINPGSGKVCFRGNPESPGVFIVNLCLSYGDFPASLTEGAGPPAPALPILGDPLALTRFRNFGLGQSTSRNGDFALAVPTPENTRGQIFVVPVDGPEIQVIPDSLNFGTQNINNGATAARTLVISNRGVVNSLIISNVALLGTHSNQFLMVTDSGEQTLGPGATRTLTVNFDPVSAGVKSAFVRIACNDTNEIITVVPLQGNGFDPNAPEIDVTPLTADFGNRDIALGPTSVRNVIIINQGAIGSLVVSNVFLSGPQADQFVILTPTNSSTLAPAASRVVAVAFDPSSAGPKTATLVIVSGDSDEPLSEVRLNGRGFDLSPCTAPNPANSVAQNICSNAQLICPGMTATGTLAAATRDGSSTCESAQVVDVWFRYVPASSGLFVALLQGNINQRVFSAHAGCPGTSANELECSRTSAVSDTFNFSVSAAVPVFLRVGGVVGAAPADFQLTIQGPDCLDFDRNQNGTTDSCEPDFGDAPAPYPTLAADNGPRHRAFTILFLGNKIDPDEDGQPTPLANGDNLDGEINDDDGVVFASPLIPGQTTSLAVQHHLPGILNAWIDFNADGDWTDTGEQIFTNRALAELETALTFNVPIDAVVTNQTFARFRFSSTPGLSFAGPAEDGEVEDYLVEILSPSPAPDALAVRISEVMAGLNGDSMIQFVELEAFSDAHKGWGPQAGETAGRAMLLFYDAAGVQSGRFVFPRNAPPGGRNVLVATRAFAELTGLQPDFIMPPEVVPVAGKVAFTSNPDNRHFDIHVAFSYGGTDYFGKTDGAGPAHHFGAELLHAISLARFFDFPFGLNRNDAFVLSIPEPRNTAGQSLSLSAAPLSEQGRTLFMRETFRGNGRTCATCHVPGRDQFGLTPITIEALPHSDPLFVFMDNVNTLKLTGLSQPSDLRGRITGTTGSAQVLSGSGDTYQVIGGLDLSGTMTDSNGNRGTFQSVTKGNLDGPTPSNDSRRGLEDHMVLMHGRGLILENIDGFKHLEVFRASPHLLTLELTKPFGLSGEFESLDDFSDGAVVQHFPKSLARIPGVDFRHPTGAELSAMSEFMFSISKPATNALNLDRLATTEAQRRGRSLFFGDEGRCSKCHSGPVLALSDGSLSGSVSNVNENFNTGVANQLVNLPIGDNLPTEPAGLTPGQSTREFNTPGLFGIRLTAPFFHDGSAMTLTDAVKFYDSKEFHDSPAGVEVGSLLAANNPEMIADVVAFLESLVELPMDFPREVAFGVRCPGQATLLPQSVTITNISSHTITITDVFMNGTNASDFSVLSDTGESSLAPGQTRRFQFGFSPASFGGKRATFEITAVDTNLLGSFSFGIALSGAELDTFVHATPLAFDFGMRDIDAPPSPDESIVITNDGSIELAVVIELVGPDTVDFTMVTETNAIPPHGMHVIQVSFSPQTQGTKRAAVRLRMLACNATSIEIPLAGIATSTVQRFAWSSIGTTQFVGMPFPVRITALDRNGDRVQNFRGTVRLAVESGLVPITPTVSTPFVDGVWDGFITVLVPTMESVLIAIDSREHIGHSDAFMAMPPNDLALFLDNDPDTVRNGRTLTYSLTVQNTGPATATGVVVTNLLPPNVDFVSATTTQGTISHSGGIVTGSLGDLPPAATAAATIVVLPRPPETNGFLTNIATVARNGAELVLDNNTRTNVVRIEPFGILSVTPVANFHSGGRAGGPFTPTNQVYTLSNIGTAALTWQARASDCNGISGLAAWWPLDGDGRDNIGPNAGAVEGEGVFTAGLANQALLFVGANDRVRVPASPTLNVGVGSGMTIELWIHPADLGSRPLVEWNNSQGFIGAHFWVSTPAVGGLQVNLVDIDGNHHGLVSTGGVVHASGFQHVALTYDKASGIGRLFHNGRIVHQANIGTFTAATAFDLFFGNRPSGASAGVFFAGLMDDIGLYDHALSPAEVQSIFNAGAASKCVHRGASAFNCAAVPSLAGWWPLNGNASDVVGTNAGLIQSPIAFTSGFVEGAVQFQGGFMRFPRSAALDVGARNGLTIELWIHPADLQPRPLVEWNNSQGFIGAHFWISGLGPAGTLHLNLVDINAVTHHCVSTGSVVNVNGFQHVAATYDKATGDAALYHNGRSVLSTNVGSFTPATAFDLFFGRRTSGAASGATYLGLMDEVGLFDRALAPAEIEAIFLAAQAGKCGGSDCRLPNGVVSWWPGENTASDRADGNHGIPQGTLSFGQGMVGQAFRFTGTNAALSIPASPNLNVGFGSGLTFEAWINPANLSVRSALMEWNNSQGGANAAGVHFHILGPQEFSLGPGNLFANLVDTGNNSHTISAPGGTLTSNVFQHVAVTYDKPTGFARLYRNGAIVSEVNVGTFTPRTSDDLFFGRRVSGDTVAQFQGSIDEPTLYNRALTSAEIESIFRAGAAGKCTDQAWLALSSLGGILPPGAGTNVSLMLKTNASSLPAGTHVETVVFTNSTAGLGTAKRTAKLVIANGLIAFGGLVDRDTIEDSAPLSVPFTIVADPGTVPPLTVTAASSNPGLLAEPIAVQYVSGGRNGTVTLTLVSNAHGITLVSLVANGSPPGGGVGPATNAFLLTVAPLNDPPTFAALGDQSVSEGVELRINALATDPDLPQDRLNFSVTSAPQGLQIDAASRVLTWTPDESQGPGAYPIAVIVTDSGSPPLSATNQFNIMVAEVNSPPAMFPIANLVATEGMAIAFGTLASDPDRPSNGFVYTLGSGAPPGANITASGTFTWTVPALPVPTTNRISVIVTDTGVPPLSDTREFSIVVTHRPQILRIVRSGPSVTLHWTALPGTRYRVQTKAGLNDPWSDVPGDVTAMSDTASASDNIGPGQRFYQIQVLP